MFAALPPPARSVRIGSVCLGSHPVKVIASLTEPTLESLTAAAHRHASSPVDIFEWRVDSFRDLRFPALTQAARSMHSTLSQPLVATVRTRFEGGSFARDEDAYEAIVTALIAGHRFDAIDVEISRTAAPRIISAAHSSGIPVIASYHNFDATPSEDDILARLSAMQSHGADVLKVAVMPQCPEDVLNFMSAIVRARRMFTSPIIAMSMGEAGRITRIAGALYGSCATFASLESASAPGQIPIGELTECLHAVSD